MKTTILSALALALSLGTVQGGVIKRQQAIIDAFAAGKMAQYLGSKGATPELEAFARLLGANETFPGTLESYMRETVNDGYGKIPRNATDVPEVEELTPRFPGARTVKWRYGPFSVPNINQKNEAGEMGMLYNYPTQEKKPCTGKCTIVGFKAGLEYRDGKNANIDNGMWLHHMVVFNIGEGRKDVTCKQKPVSVPHTVVGATSRNSERIFASGNERTPFAFTNQTHKVGYMVNEKDSFALISEFMNTTPLDHEVFLTVTYDIVDGHPEGWSHLRPVWLDIAQCGTSEIVPDTAGSKFSVKYSWESDQDGEVFGLGGHLHDGGEALIVKADDKLVCSSKATYGGSPEFIQPAPLMPAMHAGGHSHGDSATRHISKMDICYGDNLPVKKMFKGQKWDMEAAYDFSENRGVMNTDGELTEVMGIAIMFVKQKLET